MEIIVPKELPLFDQDLEADTLPREVQAYRNSLQTADAFVFSLCEYNYGLSAAVKNALDWGSRGKVGGNLFDDKPVAIVSAGGGVGGLRAQQHFRDCALFLNMQIMNKPELMVKIFEPSSPFDMATGDLVSPQIEERCGRVMAELIAWSQRLNGDAK